MSIAVVTSSPGALTPKSSNGAILRRWLKEVGINPEECVWLSLLEADLPYGDKMSAAMIRNGTARLMNEVAMHNPEVVIAVGSDATKIDSDLWRQDMSKRHGHSGKLWGKFPAIGMYHPNTYAMQKETRRRTEIENSCKLVLSRALHLNDVIEMPHVTVNDRTYVNSEVGFDCETTQDLALAKAYRGKSFQKNKTVEPRASRLKMVGTSDGLISFSGADFGPNAEPIAFNMPFDALIAADASPRPDDIINARWHDPKMWAHLLGERDTEMKSLALRLLGRPLMHYDEAGGTDAEPSYCLEPTTKVLCADLRWRDAQYLSVGTEIVAFDETPPSNSERRKFRTATVEKTERIYRPCYAITFANGKRIVSSDEHLWLGTKRGAPGLRWYRTDELSASHSVSFLVDPWESPDTYKAGYLAGMFDGEASVNIANGQITVAQNAGLVLSRTKHYLDGLGFRYTERGPGEDSDCHRLDLLGGLGERLRFIGTVWPVRLGSQRALWEGQAINHSTPTDNPNNWRVTGIEFVGTQTVCAIQTTSRTLIAEGFLSHNCVADSIAHRDILNECRRRSPAGVAWLYENVERPMLRLYSRWSRRGVFKLDAERCAAIQAIQTDELERLALAIWQKTGIPNPNQYKKVAEWLGTESADEATLREHMDRDGVPDMLDWRERNKSKSTYVDAYLLWPAPLIGTLWRPTGAWTGRPASAATNLQNVPDGCKHKSPDDLYRCVKCGSFNIRKLLGPEDGYELWSFDNSQLEIRIAAHISQDKNMLALLRGEMPGYEDGDIHRWATELLGAKNRTFGKIGNFATLYGGSEGAIIVQAAKFNVDIETIRPMAKKIHDTLPKMFPDFFAWKRTVEFRDRVPGMFGAILVPPSHPDESYLQRERVNAPIQRGGVDTLKLQTLALEAEGFETVHQIHDEVLVKVHKSDATDATRERIRAIMTQAVELDVPLKVDSKLWAA